MLNYVLNSKISDYSKILKKYVQNNYLIQK